MVDVYYQKEFYPRNISELYLYTQAQLNQLCINQCVQNLKDRYFLNALWPFYILLILL